jgi:RNA polymerase sigma-70 factor (ECF subfamily)
MLLFAIINNQPPIIDKFQIDENLIHRIGHDDPIAFSEFYRLTQKTIFSYILSIVLNPNDAEDIMQDTYLKIRSAAHLYEPQGKPMAWVFTIARNLSLMHIRSHKNIAEKGFEDFENDSIFSKIMDQEDKIILENLLRNLEETERSVILLHAVSGFKHREIAKNLGMPLATVLSKYHRGLGKLRKSINLQKGGR